METFFPTEIVPPWLGAANYQDFLSPREDTWGTGRTGRRTSAWIRAAKPAAALPQNGRVAGDIHDLVRFCPYGTACYNRGFAIRPLRTNIGGTEGRSPWGRLRRKRTAPRAGLSYSALALMSIATTPEVIGAGDHVTQLDARTATPDAPVIPGDLLFQRLLRNRIIFLGQQVDDDIANRIAAEMLLLSAEDPQRDINVYINSPGGSVYAGLAIYDVMQFVPNDVATYAMGMAASMGQFLLTAGTPGKRYAMPNSTILMHQPSGGIGGTATDIKIQAEQMRFVKKTLSELTARHTGQPLEKILKDADRDHWYTAKEAAEYGFVDHVVSSARETPSGTVTD